MDEPAGSATALRRDGQGTTTALVKDVIAAFRPAKLFPRDDVKDGQPHPRVLSIDFDDPGELCMTAESDSTIHIFNVKDGRKDKTLKSQKYGVKLATWTHANSSIIYASTKINHDIRLLATQDNSFLQYFKGHEDTVTSISMHPGFDVFLSGSLDNTLRLWSIQQKSAVGAIFLSTPYLSAWDPSGQVFAVGSPSTASILLYDYRNWTKAPISSFDVLKARGASDVEASFKGWTKLAFSNDGKHILVGSRFGGHLLLDAFDGSLKTYLKKPNGSGTRRPGVGEVDPIGFESSGDCCFSPDGQYVLGGGKKDVSVWDIKVPPSSKVLEPKYVLEDKRETGVLAYNPRFNMLASADEQLMFWLPDPEA